jgi:hypothetical protein
MTNGEARTALRERLIEMREALVEGLAAEPHLDAGMLGLLASVGSALAAIDAMPAAGSVGSVVQEAA